MESFGHVGCRATIHNTGNINSCYGTCKVGTFLCTITHYYKLVECFSCGLEIYHHIGSSGHQRCLITHIADFKLSAICNSNLEMPKGVCRHGIASNAFLHYRGADDGLVVLIKHGTSDSGSRLTLHLRLGVGLCLECTKRGRSGQKKHCQIKMLSHRSLMIVINSRFYVAVVPCGPRA